MPPFAKPSAWPPEVHYLRSPQYSTKLSRDVISALSTAPQHVEPLKDSPGPCQRVRIKAVTYAAHPAYGQRGLYACQHLLPDTFVLFYLGHVHDEAEADGSSNYDLSLDRELGVGVDATHFGNEARFINDYRGIAPAPNAEFRDVWVEAAGGKKVERRMAVYVLSAGKSGKKAKGIAKGEEIVVSYGKGFWRERGERDYEHCIKQCI